MTIILYNKNIKDYSRTTQKNRDIAKITTYLSLQKKDKSFFIKKTGIAFDKDDTTISIAARNKYLKSSVSISSDPSTFWVHVDNLRILLEKEIQDCRARKVNADKILIDGLKSLEKKKLKGMTIHAMIHYWTSLDVRTKIAEKKIYTARLLRLYKTLLVLEKKLHKEIIDGDSLNFDQTQKKELLTYYYHLQEMNIMFYKSLEDLYDMQGSFGYKLRIALRDSWEKLNKPQEVT